MKKSIVTRNVDQILIRNLIMELFIWNLDKISVFWELIIDNTPAPEIIHLLLRFDDRWHAKTAKWFASNAAEINNMQTWAHMTDELKAMHCCKKTMFPFFSDFNTHTSILSARNHFCVIFLNSHKYFQDIFLRYIRDVKE